MQSFMAIFIATPASRARSGWAQLPGARFAQTALAAGVVDELALLVMPELFGHGTRLFEGHALRRNLELVETRVMDTGAVLMRYDIRPRPQMEGSTA